MTEKSLDRKLAKILANPDCGEFILADAKDADMAAGLAAPGEEESRLRTLQEYRDHIRENTRQGLIDIMLMSASTSEVLTLQEGLFQNSHITPAIRANDTTDIWLARGSVYSQHPSRPFRTANIDHAMCGKLACSPNDRARGADLGLYSITFNNDLEHDYQALEHYNAFREEAEAKNFRHFLEVFAPNAPQAPVPDVGRFLNDMIVRLLAGVVGKSRPLFLKIPYNGPEAMESLATYDRTLVVGILGGSAGTTFDAFHQLWEAKKYGARVALYGRMINNSEHQPTFIHYLRAIADGKLKPEEAVKAYHADLAKINVKPKRSLADDLQHTRRASAYSGNSATTMAAVNGTKAAAKPASASAPAAAGNDGQPDFSKMTTQEKVAWNLQRWNRVIG